MNYKPGIHLTIEQLINLQSESNRFSHQRKRKAKSALAGSYQSKFKGRGMDFDEVRHYQPGDDIRSIDWRVTARTNKVHTKLFTEERERPVFLVLDQCMSMFFGSQNTLKSVLATSTASILLWSALSQKDRVGSLLFNETTHIEKKPSSSRKAALSILHDMTQSHNSILSHYSKQPAPAKDLPNPVANTLKDPSASPLNLNLQRLRNIVHPGAMLCLLSDLNRFDEDSARHLTMISRHNDLVIYHVTDPLDEKLPPPGTYPISDGQRLGTLDSGNREGRQKFEALIKQRQALINDCVERHNIQYHRLSTSSGNSKRLLDFLITHQSPIHRRSEQFLS